MSAPACKRVRAHVASNPVARAIERARIARSERDFALRVYSIQDGEVAGAELHDAAQTMLIASRVIELRGGKASADHRTLAAGMHALYPVSSAAHGAMKSAVESAVARQRRGAKRR